MKFGQQVDFDMRNNFLEKTYSKCGEETSPRLFSEKLKLSISSEWSKNLYTICFYCMPT